MITIDLLDKLNDYEILIFEMLLNDCNLSDISQRFNISMLESSTKVQKVYDKLRIRPKRRWVLQTLWQESLRAQKKDN